MAIGQELCEKVLIGCQVHYGRSYHRDADKVSNPLPRQVRSLSREAFCTHQMNKSEEMK